MELTEKAAYLKGLIEGLGVDDSTKEGKIIRAMSELLGEMAASIREIDDDLSQVYDDVDALCNEVEDLEADLYDDEDEDDDEDDDSTDPCYEVDCPHCGETVYVTEEDLEEGEAFCTSCGKSFEIALAPDDEDEEETEEAAEEPARYEVTCPSCGAVTVLDEDTLMEGKAFCSGCGQPLELEVTEE